MSVAEAPGLVGRTAEQPLSRRDYACVLLQLSVLTLIAWGFQLDPRHRLPWGLALVSAGFSIHALLPDRFRQPFFLGLSGACLLLVLGPMQAMLAGGIGGMLVLLALAPMAWRVRLALLALAAGVLIALRGQFASPFWIVLGSMFMFRMVSYLHCVHREGTSAPASLTWSYFFLPPNAFYALFPVVDYTTFCESYFDADRRRIYQTGVHWLTLGLLQLILYRVIKYEILPAPLEVRNLRSLMLFLAANYGLYLYVSGSFHIICGMLHLFGFNLPRTHDHYFLAASFTDIWRRINTYWKDFLMKVFFLPMFYRVRSHGVALAVVVAVLWVFLWTWLAHAWQQFWLLGVFPIHREEALLWLAAGTVVAVNALLEMLRPARTRRHRAGFLLRDSLIHWFKVAGVFVCVSAFWARWTHPEVCELVVLSLKDQVLGPGTMSWMTVSWNDLTVVTGVLLAVIAIGVLVDYGRERIRESAAAADFVTDPARPREWSFDRSVSLHLGTLIAVLMLAQAPVHSLLGTPVSRMIVGLQTERLTPGDAMSAIQGYYEQLSAGSVHAGPFQADVGQRGNRDIAVFGDMTQPRRDLLGDELIPFWDGSYGGGRITINRWGMRDRDRDLLKAAGTLRVALVGSSVIMGAGVDDPDVASRILESRLNASEERWGGRIEILNFGMGLYSPIRRRAQIDHKVIPFSPDLVVYVAHQDELDGSTTQFANAISHRLDLEDGCLEELVRQMQIPADASEIVYFARAGERPHEVLACTYKAIRRICEAARAELFYVYLPIPGDHEFTDDPRSVIEIARQSGLQTADLTGWWKSYSAAEVLVSEDDRHPNRLGQQLLAEAFEKLLRDWNKRRNAMASDRTGQP